MTLAPRVKICCISSLDEARLAIDHGAAALGLVSDMPSGPGVIGDELIAEIAAAVPPPISTFLLTARRSADAIAEQHAVCRTSTIQLVDAVAPAELQRLRREMPLVKLVQVIHVQHEASLDEALEAARFVDALLLDSGNPSLPVKELGGTGRVHDWQISRRIRERSPVPVFLAGGLRAANVRQAIDAVQPFGLDLCSSVRVDGRLNAARLAEFMRIVQGGG
ncbi:MAG: phosphoribosylanthranilate isomerase [Proteobacteria bacterium]|nr:phosphoribosylanthranilate isomerase [Pseudomonadota bacterium]